MMTLASLPTTRALLDSFDDSDDSLFGDVISRYTRAQAIADGQLVDLSALVGDVCRSHYKHPIACTAGVWIIIDKAIKNRRHCNDLGGVVHDMLWMSRKVSHQINASTRSFRVIITGAGRSKYHDFVISCGPGDNAEPVMTIMLPGED